MCKNDKQLGTKKQKRRRVRRGKTGTKAIARQEFVSVAKQTIPLGRYAERLALKRVLDKPMFRQDLKHSANLVVAEG